MTLTPEEYEAGRRVKDPKSGEQFDVRGALTAGNGEQYLIVTQPDASVRNLSGLIPVGGVREEWESRDPEEVQAEREKEYEEYEAREDHQDALVTDAPDVTDPQQPSPDNPQNPPATA